MSGSTFGKNFTVTTWGESHGKAIGAVIDGCPAGLSLSESDIQVWLDRRRPGQSRYTTKRRESDTAEILSGVFEGRTTGCPISVLVRNEDQHSGDYSKLAGLYRPGHADYGFDAKYGFCDYRGGGRSSGRETIGRVIAGAVAGKILSQMGIEVIAYTRSIGPVSIETLDLQEISQNPFAMPDRQAASRAGDWLEACMADRNSSGGVIECLVRGLPAGIGDPVFDKLDARLGQALFSIGSVKGVEIGDGFLAASAKGSENNDPFLPGPTPAKASNHAGGILGGISDGSELVARVAIKPTPSISRPQQTVSRTGEPVTLEIGGRHDPVIVPRAVIVVQSMTAITLLDSILSGLGSRLDQLLK